MNDPLAAFDAPPRVSAVDGEIVIIGDGVCVAYTPDAALALSEALRAVATGEKTSVH